jgi:hypothetical protein
MFYEAVLSTFNRMNLEYIVVGKGALNLHGTPSLIFPGFNPRARAETRCAQKKNMRIMAHFRRGEI